MAKILVFYGILRSAMKSQSRTLATYGPPTSDPVAFLGSNLRPWRLLHELQAYNQRPRTLAAPLALRRAYPYRGCAVVVQVGGWVVQQPTRYRGQSISRSTCSATWASTVALQGERCRSTNSLTGTAPFPVSLRMPCSLRNLRFQLGFLELASSPETIENHTLEVAFDLFWAPAAHLPLTGGSPFPRSDYKDQGIHFQ